MSDRISAVEFDDIFRQLICSAIDAYMATVAAGAPTPGGGMSVSDGHRSHKYEGYYFLGGNLWCKEPDERGNGGGAIYELMDDGLQKTGAMDYTDEFERIRVEIGRLISPWRYLPDPGDIKPILTTINSVYADLCPNGTAASSDGSNLMGPGAVASGSVDAKRRHMESVLPLAFAGTTVTAMSGYLDSLSQKLDHIRFAALLLTLNVATEYGIWDGVQADVVQVMRDCTEKFKATTEIHCPSWDWKVALNVLTCIAGAVCWFVPAFSAVTEGAITTLGAIEVAKNAGATGSQVGNLVAQTETSHIAGLRTYGDVKAQLEANLSKLNATIKNQENDIRNKAKQMLDDILANETNYDFTPEEVAWESGELGDPTKISHDRFQADSLTSLMEQISAILHTDSRALSLNSGLIRFYIHRSPEIGVANGYGPSAILEELMEAISDFLETISIEYDEGSRNVTAASNYLDAVESGSQARIAQTRTEMDDIAHGIEEGTGIDPLSFQYIDWYQKMNGTYPTDLTGEEGK